jgi:hypothetical protein
LRQQGSNSELTELKDNPAEHDVSSLGSSIRKWFTIPEKCRVRTHSIRVATVGCWIGRRSETTTDTLDDKRYDILKTVRSTSQRLSLPINLQRYRRGRCLMKNRCSVSNAPDA